MNIWVEYWKIKGNRSHTEGSHAQMKENTKWVEPKSEDIGRRYFDYQEGAFKFAKIMNDKGYFAKIKTDGHSK